MDRQVLTRLRARFAFAAQYPDALATAKLLDKKTIETPALRLISDAVRETLATPDGRLIISMPPQEGKTQLVRAATVHHLATHPDDRVVFASYGIDLGRKHGRWIRDRIREHSDTLGIAPRRGHAAVNDWSLEGHRGGVLSVGVGTGLTGNPADLAIIDDPIKDREQADSEIQRDKVWEWYTDVLASRLAPGASVIVILTRWHEDDLAGRLPKQDLGAPWRILNIPAQCDDEATDPLGRQVDEFMISARGRTELQWQQRKATAGPRGWNALYQGRPTAAEGNIFKREHWRFWDTPPWVELDGRCWVREGTLIQSWDMTFKGKPTSDFVVGQVWWRNGAQAWLLDQVRGRWGFSETSSQVIALSNKWPQAVAKFVEDKANGSAIIESLSLQIPGLTPVEPEGGKMARAYAIEPLITAHNVLLPQYADWKEDLIEEAAAFPNAAHDDQVDTLTQALTKLYITDEDNTLGSTFYNIG